MNGAAEPQEETVTLIGGPFDGEFREVLPGPKELLVGRYKYLIDWNLNIANYEGIV